MIIIEIFARGSAPRSRRRRREKADTMTSRICPAALLALLVLIAASHPAFSADEKSPNECGTYLTEMSQVLDTLEALVPNVPPDEASYLEKKTPHLLHQVRENGFLMLSIAPYTRHGICTTNFIRRGGN